MDIVPGLDVSTGHEDQIASGEAWCDAEDYPFFGAGGFVERLCAIPGLYCTVTKAGLAEDSVTNAKVGVGGVGDILGTVPDFVWAHEIIQR